MSMQNKIKERRIALGLTQEDLADKLGLQKSAIAKYESGRVENIKRSVIKKMAAALDCSAIYLLDFDGEQITPQEDQLLKYFRTLNDGGKLRALSAIEELTEINRYREEAYYVVPEDQKRQVAILRELH